MRKEPLLGLRLLIDEDTQSRLLIRLLRETGHELTTVSDVQMEGRPDRDVLAYACSKNLIILTRNARDFYMLHEQNPEHPGILAIYHDKEPAKNMDYKSIVKAVSNVQNNGLELSRQFIVLNAWNF